MGWKGGKGGVEEDKKGRVHVCVVVAAENRVPRMEPQQMDRGRGRSEAGRSQAQAEGRKAGAEGAGTTTNKLHKSATVRKCKSVSFCSGAAGNEVRCSE